MTTSAPADAPSGAPKLVATDLDGTLLRSDGTLSARTAAALTAAEAAGIRLALVTGRPPRSLGVLHADIGHHFAITANGAAVYAPDGTPVRLSPFPAPPLAALVARVRAAVPGVSFAFEYERDFGHEPDYPAWSYGESSVELIGTAEELLDRAAGRQVFKVLAHHPELSLRDFHARARTAAGADAETTHSTGLALVEFSAPGVTKASALTAWSAGLGLGRDDIAAFGDMPNDLPMLGAVGRPYAVANADPEVRRAARFHTASNDEDGVARVLEQFVRLARAEAA
ncbi:HAD family hydrolase [Streptomyces sp. MMBL 11-3]|uniref:HAD family hydrolase n=1 Tax=Streptomyces sp. MMBL 11-3 TaxID=3382639 RepID=UPI0039B4E981